VIDPPELELGRLQRRLWRLISEPKGVAAALAAEEEPGAGLSRLFRSDRGPAPNDRLSVYANAYFVRIHDCLRRDFGALARALGPAAFHDLVKCYLMVEPPWHPSLRYAGRNLARFLETEPFASIFARRCPYGADLARLEWAFCDAFDAADAPVLEREELSAVAPETWGSQRLKTTSSLAVLTLGFPVHSLRERFDHEEETETWEAPPALEPAQTLVRVWRREETVYYRAVSALEAVLLRALQRGEDLGALCEHVAGEVGERAAAGQAARFLESWLSAGLLCAKAQRDPRADLVETWQDSECNGATKRERHQVFAESPAAARLATRPSAPQLLHRVLVRGGGRGTVWVDHGPGDRPRPRRRQRHRNRGGRGRRRGLGRRPHGSYTDQR
jgi:hypothetical protein